MPNGIDRSLQATVIAAALCDIADACRALGIKPPTGLAFSTAQARNTISDVLEGIAKVEPLRIRKVPSGQIEVDGIRLKVRFD